MKKVFGYFIRRFGYISRWAVTCLVGFSYLQQQMETARYGITPLWFDLAIHGWATICIFYIVFTHHSWRGWEFRDRDD